MIRPATSQDAGWIAALWNAMISETLHTFTTDLKSVADVSEMIRTRPILVLPEDAGFATYGPFRSGPGYAATVEHTILIDPAAQGHGQGRVLMQTLMDHARDAGHHVMVAGISGANPGAVAFHAAMGFDRVAQMPEVGRKHGQWLDLILMQKLL
ncbi:N-acetyltransferase family protein [Tateyamaria armeniaca]|uniref:N-acetyltransferase family protein n=1 Tax=Tateyamaria armeniaca TaxID=2518930 RepID=A0ABW8V267_9RHOB